jgi:hypothetical protein
VADFRMVSSQVHLSYIGDEEIFALDPGCAGDLALWGGGPNGESLNVRSEDAGVIQVGRVAPPSRGSDLRAVSIKAVHIGETTLTARLPNGNAWATANVAVGFTPGRMSTALHVPLDGEIPFVVGIAAIIRIPVPGTNGLAIELGPRGWTPKGGSTSTLFIQDAVGKRNLRLDYGFNVKTGTVNYHWNQKGTFPNFGITDHATVGTVGRVAYKTARYFKYAGRTLLVVGLVLDAYSIVTASKPLRQAAKVASGWAGAWVGCKVVGAGGAWVGTAVTPGIGTAVGGVAGCIAGGFIGYEGASRAAGRLYDWGEAQFRPLEETASP